MLFPCFESTAVYEMKFDFELDYSKISNLSQKHQMNGPMVAQCNE